MKPIYVTDTPRKVTVAIDNVRHTLDIDECRKLRDELSKLDGIGSHSHDFTTINPWSLNGGSHPPQNDNVYKFSPNFHDGIA